MRKSKGFTQLQIAEKLFMDASGYSRRESGEVYIKMEEWEKIAKILGVQLKEIYESEENQSFTCKDNATANFLGTNLGTSNFYAVPDTFLEIKLKYIAKLEEEIIELKQLLGKK
jgi:transcriptional regulator with XRE-family HTH domain